MEPILIETPETFTFSGVTPGEVVERDARLLVAGSYPAKKLEVTEADLDALVANFSEPVPVKVEHIDSPLDPLGHVQAVWRDGAQLLGRVRFPATMAAFLSARGAEKLSVGLLKEPAWKLLEASLTLRPHVASATLLSETAEAPPAPNNGGAGAEPSAREEAVMAELVELRAERLEGQIAGLKAAGRLVPAAEPLARALLTAPAVVTLSEGKEPETLGQVFLRFLEAQPPVVQMGELAKANAGGVTLGGAAGVAGADPDGDGSPEAFSEDEKEVLRRLGVEPAEVAKTMADERRQKKGIK